MHPARKRAATHLDVLATDHPLHAPLSDALDCAGGLTPAFVDLLPPVLECTGSTFGFLAEVVYATPQRPYLHSHAVVDIYKPNYTIRDIVTNLNFHNLDTLNGAIMTSRAPVIANAPASDPRSGGVPAGHRPIQSFLGLPFLVDDQLVGACAMANKSGGYANADVELCQPLCEIGGLLIAAARL